MSYYLQSDGQLGQQIASNVGWGDFGRWADTLGDYPEVAHFVDAGWSDEPALLLSQLVRAEKSNRPPNADTASVVGDVVDAIRSAGAKVVVSVTDGLGPDEQRQPSLVALAAGISLDARGPIHFRTIDGEVRPIGGEDPNPAESARWKANRNKVIDRTIQARKEHGSRDGSGGGAVARAAAKAGGPVAGKTVAPGDASPAQGREDQRRPASDGPAKAVPAEIGHVNAKIDRYANFFRGKGNHKVAGWLDKLKGHVNAVGVNNALESLGEAKGSGDGGTTQYQGVQEMGDFAASYLNRAGIHIVGHEADTALPSTRVVSSLAPSQQAFRRKGEGDFFPADPKAASDKLAEAKLLPGLERSEALPDGVTHLTPKVMGDLDAKFGKGKWIVKPYGDEAAAGHGIFFSQKAERIQQDAQSTIHAASGEIVKHGFSLDRNATGKLVGIKHEAGDKYKFGSDESGTPRNKQYTSTINGHVREWADKAAVAANNEHGAALPDGGKEFMAQPAFNVVGVSEADRAAGKTWEGNGEGRVHVVTRNGKATAVPHSTWIKGDDLPIVFENGETRAMAKAAEDAVNQLPASDRNGQIFAPDIVRTDQGYKAVEVNPANHTGGSGYLTDNPHIIDSYVSHLTGRDPAHVQFIRNLLTEKGHGSAFGNAAGAAIGGGQGGGAGGDRGLAKDDAGGAGGIDAAKRSIAPRDGIAPEALAQKLKGVARLPDAEWDKQSPAAVQQSSRQTIAAAKRAGIFVPQHELAGIRQTPNVGNFEHEVHEGSDGRFYKMNQPGHFGNNRDVHDYVERHELANKMFPELDYKFHGVAQDPATGHAQTIMSMNRVEGTHPHHSEVTAWFKKNGWVSNEGKPNAESKEHGIWSWKDPHSGTVISDANPGNVIKTKSGGIVPIDVDIRPGHKAPRPMRSAVALAADIIEW